jgi:hypothetical protein
MTRLPPVAPAQHRRTIAACRDAARADVTTVTEITIEHAYDRGHETRSLSATTDRHGGASGAATQHTMGACVMTTLRSMSRRSFLPLIAGAALSPVVLVPQSARAQDPAWQIYRREDLGFEIEMPGRPAIRKERIDGQATVEVTVDVDRLLFGVGYLEYDEAVSLQEFAAAQRLVARSLGSTVVRESAIMMNGFPGLEIIMESNLLSMAMRVVLVPERKRSISAMVSGDGRLSENPSVRRFLDSFKLLP